MSSNANVQTVTRLAPDVYKQLAAKVPPPAVGHNTTPVEASWLLGAQYVLQLVREGFTIGE